MKKSHYAAAALMVAGAASMAVADEVKKPAPKIAKPAVAAAAKEATPAATVKKAAKPADSPGWVVIDEVWWYPLRFEPANALKNARYHYRRKEESAAAYDIRKAVTWMKYAARHALPVSRSKLESASAELTTLSNDLDAGKTASAAFLDAALTRASHALAEWHYYKARDWFGKGEERYAAKDLQAAALHLQQAADSARHKFGVDSLTLFDTIRNYGLLAIEEWKLEKNYLAEHLQGVEKAVSELAGAMKKAVD